MDGIDRVVVLPVADGISLIVRDANHDDPNDRLPPPTVLRGDDGRHVVGLIARTPHHLSALLAAVDAIATHPDTFVMAVGGLVLSERALRTALDPATTTVGPGVSPIDAWFPNGVHVPDVAGLEGRPLVARAARETLLRTLAAERLLEDDAVMRSPAITNVLMLDPMTPHTHVRLLGELQTFHAFETDDRRRRAIRRDLNARIAAARHR
jgi:hypothetical protein